VSIREREREGWFEFVSIFGHQGRGQGAKRGREKNKKGSKWRRKDNTTDNDKFLTSPDPNQTNRRGRSRESRLQDQV
jgi:hypothetical protein